MSVCSSRALRRHSLVVRIPRCGRGDLGSIPSEISNFFFSIPSLPSPSFCTGTSSRRYRIQRALLRPKTRSDLEDMRVGVQGGPHTLFWRFRSSYFFGEICFSPFKTIVFPIKRSLSSANVRRSESFLPLEADRFCRLQHPRTAF